MNLTLRQKAILAFLIAAAENDLAKVSLNQIARHFKMKSTSQARDPLNALVMKGYIERIHAGVLSEGNSYRILKTA